MAPHYFNPEISFATVLINQPVVRRPVALTVLIRFEPVSPNQMPKFVNQDHSLRSQRTTLVSTNRGLKNCPLGPRTAAARIRRPMIPSKRRRMAATGIKDSLKQQGVRLTRQRKILLDLIDQSGQHLDAEALFRLAKEKDPKLNRVTVYRTLKLLKMGGLVDELDLMHHAGDQHYYETRLKQEHAHVICLRCGKIEEFFGDPLQAIRDQIANHFGFEVVLARTEVGGYCSHCQVLRAREMEAAAKAAH